MVIDFHTHIFTDKIAKTAVSNLAKKGNVKNYLDGTLAQLEESMARAGIDRSVVLPVITKPTQTDKINRWVAGLNRPGIIPFGGIHPQNEQHRENLKLARELGLKGIKLHPDYQDFFIDDPKYRGFLYDILDMGFILVIHSGLDVGYQPPYHCTPQRLRHVLDDMKGGTIVAAHLGGHTMWDEVERYLVGQKVYLDTSMGLRYYGADTFRRIVANHGSENMLFATDSPWEDQGEELKRMRSFGLEERDLENILYRTAVNLLR